MKKIAFILLFLVIGLHLYSQDFEPGEQARGYLDRKNMLVDHTTGTFHYKVPICVVRSGNFELPVSLDYTSRGIKVDDVPGLLGHGWTLNTGGVVTRTIRGGIADEEMFLGAMWLDLFGMKSEQEVIDSVNNRKLDGECDLFTAVFNGQSVNFIIRRAGNKIIAEPLERTNVRIECLWYNDKTISGWRVTDEHGNLYIYQEKEWTRDINKEDAISFNGVRDKSYVSSWYLSRIEPYNREAIVFEYLENTRDGQNINKLKYDYYYDVTYLYGWPMKDYTLNTQRYLNEFNRALEEASSYLENYALEQRAKNQMYVLDQFNKWVDNPIYEITRHKIETNYRVMGQLANMKDVISCDKKLISVFDNLLEWYENESSLNAMKAANCIRSARQYALNSIERVADTVLTKRVSGGMAYEIHSSLLRSISSTEGILEFQYSDRLDKYGRIDSTKHLSRLVLYDVTRQRISEVRVGETNALLQKLSFVDKSGGVTGEMNFGYYSFGECGTDMWGYAKRPPTLEELQSGDYSYVMEPDPLYSKNKTLQSITLVNGGRITVDFESNITRDPKSRDEKFYDLTPGTNYGGIRIKSLVVEDCDSRRIDSVLYSYPILGIPVIGLFTNYDKVDYQGFRDQVILSRGKFHGISLLNTGNNGIYYPYVIETMRGRGSKAYLFYADYVPESLRYEWYSEYSAYWQNGLPLAEAIYDEYGHLKQIVKNKYYMNRKVGNSAPLSGVSYASYFANELPFTGYDKVLPQFKAYEYYLDEKKIEAYYRDQEVIEIGNVSINPYRDVYMVNFYPRTRVMLPRQTYKLFYGGKTLLKEQVEFRYESRETSGPSIADFDTKTVGVPFQTITYFYDNPGVSINPTRIMRKDSRGNTATVVEKRVTEMSGSADPVIEKMKRLNLLSPVVKRLTLYNDKIIDETVEQYVALTGDTLVVVPSSRYVDIPEQLVMYEPSALDATLFTRDKAGYLEEKSIVYQRHGKLYLPVQVNTRSGSSVVCYDALWKRPVLKIKDVKTNSVAVADMKVMRENSNEVRKIGRYILIQDVSGRIISGFTRLLEGEWSSSDILNYIASSNSYHAMRVLMEYFNRGAMHYTLLQEKLDTVKANDFYHIKEFYLQCRVVTRDYPDFGVTLDEIGKFLQCIGNEIDLEDYLRTLDNTDYKAAMTGQDPLMVSIPQTSIGVKLFVLCNRPTVVKYTCTCPDGMTNKNLSCGNYDGYRVHVLDLDLVGGTTSVSLNVPFDVAYIALVPADAVFEATSYNLDGTVFCRFDQTGQAEFNEYDAAGRLVRVIDNNGKVLKEMEYQVTGL